MAENSAAGTAVGVPVTGTPYDDGDDQTDDALTYSLTGKAADSGLFVIDSASGQISVAENAVLDYETDDTHREIEYWPPDSKNVHSKFYRGEVRYTVNGHAAHIEVLISLDDILPPGKTETPSLARTRSAKPANPALNVSWTALATADNRDPVARYEVQYRKKAAQGENPAGWTAYTGELSVQTTCLVTDETCFSPETIISATLPDLEAGATYEAQARAVGENEGPGAWSDTATGTANTPPRITSPLTDRSIAWRGTSSDDLSDNFADADGDTLRYSVISEHPALVSVRMNGSNLEARADNPAPSTAAVTYGARDGYGGYASGSYNASVVANATRSIAENSAAGAPVGDPVAGTPYKNETLSYALTGEAATSGAFVINRASGQVSVAQGATLDYETKKSYTGKVHWTVQDQAVAANLTINVIDAGPPGQPDAPEVTASDTAPLTTLDVSWTAPQAPASAPVTGYDVQYRQSASDSWTDHPFNSAQTDTALTGLISGTTYQVQVRARNIEGAGAWSQPGSGYTGAQNRPPQFSRVGAQREIAENSPAGASVGGPVTAIDREGHTLTYSMKRQSPLFSVESGTGQIKVAQGASLDYEAQDSYTVVIEASDGRSVTSASGGHIVDPEITVTISVTDMAEGPPKPDAPSVTRSSSSPQSELDVTWTAPDMTGKPPITSYEMQYKPASGAAWKTGGVNGLATSATISNLEAGTTYLVRVMAHNDEGVSPWSDNGQGSTAGRIAPTPGPTTEPTPGPTPEPTAEPTPEPTPGPTLELILAPTAEPTPYPTPGPTPASRRRHPRRGRRQHPHPTPAPTPGPTAGPTPASTPGPTPAPTTEPTPHPPPGPTPALTPGPTPASTPGPTPAATPARRRRPPAEPRDGERLR